MKNRVFDRTTTTDEVLEGINLKGKNALVTGGTSGLGFETARALSARGANVTIIGPSEVESKDAVEKLALLTGNAFEYGVFDLSKFDTVRGFANKWLANNSELHILINGAGVMCVPYGKTKEGCELHFAINYLGHFLFTNLLTSALVKGAPSRIISLSSASHYLSDVDFDDIHFEKKKYNSSFAYGQSKTAIILFAREFDRRFKDKNIRAFAVHPGVIQTNLGRYLTEETIAESMEATKSMVRTDPEKSIAQGASTIVWGATAEELDGLGGLYLLNNQLSKEGVNIDERRAPYAYNLENEKRLWDVSNMMLKTTF